MNNLYKIKQIILSVLVIVIIVIIFLNIKHNKNEITEIKNEPAKEGISQQEETRSLCYYRSTPTDRGFYDKAWLKLNIKGNKVTGEFQHLPAESDSKVGTFEGTLGPLDQKSMSRSSLVWWNSRAEGMEVKEELNVKWGDGSATVGFGEMVDRGDGVYVYKDKTNLFYIKAMDQIDCDNLEEKVFVEKYIRDNIQTIATNKAVLGGSWYATSISVNSATKTGEVTYEDGHIQNKATFVYEYLKATKKLNILKFEIKK